MTTQERFVDALFGPAFEEQQCAVGFLLPSRKTEWLSDMESLIEFGEQNKHTSDVYIGCAVAEGPSESGKRQRAAEVSGITSVWADVDLKSEVHAAQGLPGSVDEVACRISDNGLPTPTATVWSGHGVHLWWMFKEALLFHSEDDRNSAARLVAGYQETLRKIIGSMDSTHDLARILRLPGTMNRKRDPIAVTLDEDYSSWTTYNPQDLEEFCAQSVSLSIPGEAADVIEPAEFPNEKILGMITHLDGFDKTWLKQRPASSFPSKQNSQSEYDMAVASMCARVKMSENEIVAVLMRFRQMHNQDMKRPGYFTMTARKAAAAAAEMEADEHLENYDLRPEETPVDVDQNIETLREKLRAPITGVTKYLADPPTYTLHTERGDIHCGEVGGLISQERMRNAVAATCGIYIPHMKGGTWRTIAQMLLDIAKEDEVGEEAKELGYIQAWLGNYFADKPVLQDKNAEGVIRSGHPFLHEDQIALIGHSFRHFLSLRGERITDSKMGRLLRKVGAVPTKVGVKVDKAWTTRHVWLLPRPLTEEFVPRI